jgi:cell wall-associated NlpC family hydrolase
VKNVYKKTNGAKLPRTTQKLFKIGRDVRKNELAVGDLVFFGKNRRKLTHVGIYLGDNKMAHASASVGVTISPIDDPYFEGQYMGARRLF